MIKRFYWYRSILIIGLIIPTILHLFFRIDEIHSTGLLWYIRDISNSSSNKNFTALVMNYYMVLTPFNVWLISASKFRPVPVEIKRDRPGSAKALLVYVVVLSLMFWPMTHGSWRRFGDDFRILLLSAMIYGYMAPQLIFYSIKVISFLALAKNSDSEK